MQEAFDNELIGFAHDYGLSTTVQMAAKLDTTLLVALICGSDSRVKGFSFNIDGTRYETFLRVFKSIEGSTKCKEINGADYTVMRHTYYFHAGITHDGCNTSDVMGKTYETIIETYFPITGGKPHHVIFVDVKEKEKFDRRWTVDLEDYTIIDTIKIGCIDYVFKNIMTSKLERIKAV